MFGVIDWIVIGIYFAAMAGIGAFFSRRNRDFKDFMFGGGSMPWLAVGISLIATSVSASTFLGNPADAFASDMSLLMLNAGSLAAIVVVGLVFIPRFRKAGIHSAYELLERRFSRPVRLTAAVFYCCHLLLRTGLLVYVPSLVLVKIMGTPLWVSIVVMSAMSILYTYHGGIKAVTWTDVIQFLIFFGSGLAAIFFIVKGVGSFRETWEAAAQAGKTHWFDLTLDPKSERNLWSAGAAYMFFEMAIRGCDQQFVQRYLSCKSVKEANLSSISSVVLGICVGLVFFFLGACLYVYYKVKAVQPLPEMSVNEVFPYFILNTLPTGLKGLLVAAILAAAMSSLSSAYTALSNTTVIDFFRSDSGDDAARLARARRWVLLWGIIGTAAAFACVLGNVSILKKALFFTSLFTGPLLGLFLLAFFRPGLNPKAVLAAAWLGMAALLPFLQIPILPPGYWTPWYEVSWPWNPLISMSATMVLAHLLDFALPRKTENGR